MTIALTRRDALRLLGFGAVAAAVPAVLLEEPRRRIWQVGAQLERPPASITRASLDAIHARRHELGDANDALRRGWSEIVDGLPDGGGLFMNSHPPGGFVSDEFAASVDPVYDFSSVPHPRRHKHSDPRPITLARALAPWMPEELADARADLERAERQAGAPTGHYADVLKLDRRLVRS